MRFTRTVCFSAVTLGLLGAAPALAAPTATTDEVVATIKDGTRYVLDDAPTCSTGERAVWVDRDATVGEFYRDPFTGKWTYYPGTPAYHGWECQPRLLQVIP